MTNDRSRVSIKFANEFEKKLYRLSKKYRNIRKDLEPILEQLAKGIFLGDRFIGFGLDIYIYKVRVKNSNLNKGKSGGYRIIYLVESALSIVLLTIYNKSQQEDISIVDIQSILNQFDKEE
jgi:mRNA-degrading endonuclease RelE of RelBE toxin-antitoxin system